MPKDIQKTEFPPENQKFSKIIIVLLAIFLAITLTAAGYFFSKYQTLSQQVKTPKKTTPPTVASKKTAAPQAIVKGPSFQEILKSSCQEITLSPTVSYFGINQEDLPVSIDKSALSVQRLTCAGEDLPNSNFVAVEYEDRQYLYLYDKNSKEPGHGGQSFFGTRPVVLKDDGTTQWSMSLNWPEAGCAELDNIVAIVRAEKKLNLLNGETITISTEMPVTQPGDPKIATALKQNLKSSECTPGQKEVTYEGADEKVKLALFSNFTADENIQKTLMAITPKEIVATKTSTPQTTLTESTALSVAQQQIGACECTNRSAAVAPAGANTWTVTITDTGLMDDSVSAQQTNGTITYQSGNYVWKTTNTLFRCAPGRGHQNFSTALCE